MQRYKAEVEYVGTGYAGMQKQELYPTIQGAIEKALSEFTLGIVDVIDYCGRTDSGVHAFAQVIHFDIPIDSKTERNILLGINFFLRKNGERIALKNVEKVPENFHSRFWCHAREYKYYIYNALHRSPVFEGRMHYVERNIDVQKMQDSANFLLGTHDFSSFRTKGCQASSPIKTIDFIKIKKITQEIIEIHIGARSFLYRMVRNITGALIYSGIGKFEPEFIKEILEKKDISFLPYTAPACGLYFFKAHYKIYKKNNDENQESPMKSKEILQN